MNATSACVCRLAGCYRQKTSKLQKPNKIHFFPSSSFTPLLSKRFFFPSQRRADLKGGKKLNQRRIRAHGKKKLCTASPIPFHPPKTKPAWPIHSTPKRIPRFWWVFMSFTILHFHLPSEVLNKCRFLPTVQTHTQEEDGSWIKHGNGCGYPNL